MRFSRPAALSHPTCAALLWAAGVIFFILLVTGGNLFGGEILAHLARQDPTAAGQERLTRLEILTPDAEKQSDRNAPPIMKAIEAERANEPEETKLWLALDAWARGFDELGARYESAAGAGTGKHSEAADRIEYERLKQKIIEARIPDDREAAPGR